MKNLSFLLLVFSLVFLQSSCNLDLNQNTENEKADTTAESSSQDADLKQAEPTSSETAERTLAYGIDISKFQGDEIDFLNKRADELSFVICKATEGITYTDPKFSNNWNTIPEKGFIRGAYHFFRSQDNPIHQAENYLNAIHDLSIDNLPPIVDFEGGGIDKSQPKEAVQNSLLLFLERIEQEWDRVPIIYVDKSIGDRYLDNPIFSKYPLWIASYEAEKTPPVPTAWADEKWMFWQKSSSYKINGQKNDLDCFNGNVEKLLGFISGD